MKPFNTVTSFFKVEYGNMISIKLRETFDLRAPLAYIQVAVLLNSQRILTVSQISKYQRVFRNSGRILTCENCFYANWAISRFGWWRFELEYTI